MVILKIQFTHRDWKELTLYLMGILNSQFIRNSSKRTYIRSPTDISNQIIIMPVIRERNRDKAKFIHNN